MSVCAEEACARQRFERAGRLLGAVEGLWEGLGFSLSPADEVYFERSRSAVRAALGGEALAHALAEGHAMTPGQAVAFAVDALAATPGSGVRP